MENNNKATRLPLTTDEPEYQRWVWLKLRSMVNYNSIHESARQAYIR